MSSTTSEMLTMTDRLAGLLADDPVPLDGTSVDIQQVLIDGLRQHLDGAIYFARKLHDYRQATQRAECA
jgi:hypothetical protein